MNPHIRGCVTLLGGLRFALLGTTTPKPDELQHLRVNISLNLVRTLQFKVSMIQ